MSVDDIGNRPAPDISIMLRRAKKEFSEAAEQEFRQKYNENN
jgi:hypothetical protein